MQNTRANCICPWFKNWKSSWCLGHTSTSQNLHMDALSHQTCLFLLFLILNMMQNIIGHIYKQFTVWPKPQNNNPSHDSKGSFCQKWTKPKTPQQALGPPLSHQNNENDKNYWGEENCRLSTDHTCPTCLLILAFFRLSPFF